MPAPVGEMMVAGDYLARRALYSPHKVGVIDAGVTPTLRLTYRQMNDRANRLARWLRTEAGVQKDDRVAILARDGIAHLDCFFACGKLGAVHTPFNWRLHWRELARLIAHTTPSTLIFSGEFAGTVSALRQDPSCASLKTFVHLEPPAVGDSVAYEWVLREGEADAVTSPDLNEEDIAALIFTGGTTGLPRGAQISHRMIAWNTLNTVIHDLHHNDVYVNVFPLYHTGGLFVYTLPNIIMGGTTILTRQFEPAQVLDLIVEHKATIFAAVPTMYQMLAQAPNWAVADLSSLRFCTSGGAPLPVPLVEKYNREKGVQFKQGFGMTEFGPGIFALAVEDAIRKAGSIGRPNFFVSARIVDDENRPLPAGEIGELVLKGPSASSGYFGDAQATEEAIDDEGWFHTGDLALVDEDGYFYIKDRKKDMFISGGENIYPAEIEAVLYRHPAVHQCAVVGVPDARWGEAGLACVVLQAGAEATPEALGDYLRDNLARYKVPKKVLLLESLPVSGAGKILKEALRQKYGQ